MRVFPWHYLAVLLLFFLLAAASCSTENAIGAIKTREPVFPVLPYLDVASLDTPPAHAAASLGMSGCILGFVVATSKSDATPSWGLAGAADGKTLSREISQLRQRGLDLWISFGGEHHHNLACVAEDPSTLMQLYAGVVRAYDVAGVDFDIEGEALKDRAAVLRRAQAWQLWKARGDMPPTILTIPVLPTGLTPEALHMLQVHRDLGVLPDWLNLMVMNYGPANAPDPEGRMAEYAINAASNTLAQLRAHAMDKLVGGSTGFARMGLTPMVGYNAIPREKFHLDDARRLRKWAEISQPGFLSFWSLNRDRSCERHQGACSYCSSGIVQAELEFFRTLAALPASTNQP